jgi:hypothetical protein
MPETNMYRIVITNETGSQEKPKAVATNNANATETTGPGKGKGSTTEVGTGIKTMAIIGYAKSIINRVWSSSVNTITLRTGHEELQQRHQFIQSTVNRGINLVQSVIAGASTGGPVGAVVGAVASIGMGVFDLGMKSYELNLARQQENVSIYFNQVRIGAGGGRMGRNE